MHLVQSFFQWFVFICDVNLVAKKCDNAKVQSLVTTFQDVEESNLVDRLHFDHIRTIANNKTLHQIQIGKKTIKGQICQCYNLIAWETFQHPFCWPPIPQNANRRTRFFHTFRRQFESLG